MILKYQKLFKVLTSLSVLFLSAPNALAQSATIDTQNNIWNTKPADFRPQLPTARAGLKNCQGAIISSGICRDYSIENAMGDGLSIRATGVIVGNPQIIGASGNGITINGNGCIIDGGIIDGARGVGILVTGKGNIIKNVTIVNCSQPIVINGVGNIVAWSTIHSTRDAWVNAQQTPPQNRAIRGAFTRSSNQTYGTLNSPTTQTYAQMQASSATGQLATPQTEVMRANQTSASASVEGKLLKTKTQPVQLKAKEQTF
jgi:hypothetical protein